MYNNIKSCVICNSTKSKFFLSNIGVRQGENLSPILFSLYLNDLHHFFENSTNINGIQLNTFSDNALGLLKLFILLYADDTAILAESEGDLKNALIKYENYCKAWKLTVNVDKFKIIVFSKRRQTNYDFNLCGSRLKL